MSAVEKLTLLKTKEASFPVPKGTIVSKTRAAIIRMLCAMRSILMDWKSIRGLRMLSMGEVAAEEDEEEDEEAVMKGLTLA